MIKLLLIDDNPEYAFCSKDFVGVLPAEIQGNNKITEIPWVSRQNYADDNELYLRLAGVENYFELKWLQFPTDVFFYRNMSLEIKLKFGLDVLEKEGFVPDLIIFDYALTDSRQENASKYYNYQNDNALNKFINPNISLSQYLMGVCNNKIILPREAHFNDTSPPLTQNANFDSYGLYCGGLIAEMYRYEKPIAAIPVTRKNKNTIANEPDAAIFEWLLNDSYHKAFDREKRTQKDWNEILNDSLEIFRKEIVNMLAIGKITPSLSQLINLAGGILGDRKFSFNSVYGEKVLPLDGLFIDEPMENREKAISAFAEECLKLHLKNANDGLTTGSLDAAINFCKDLLGQYDKKDLFFERVRFSQLRLKLKNNTLSDENREELNAINAAYGMKDEDEEYKNHFDLRCYNGANSSLVKRYAALFVMVNIYYRFTEFRKNNLCRKEYKGKPYLFTQPEKMDYILAIYPRPSTPIVMPLHEKSDGHDNDLKRNTKRVCTDDIGILVGSVLNKIEKGGITKGEKILLQSYATGIGLSKENFAEWFI